MRPEDTAEHLKAQQEAEAAREAQIAQLWSMRIFDTIMTPDGHPMVSRVPGGWIWYLFAEKGLGVTSTFVPAVPREHA